MAASANLHPGKVSMFEPVHGSAPKYRGKGVANPMAAILSAGLMLSHLGYDLAAEGVERAICEALEVGVTTPDLGGGATTSEVGDYVAEIVQSVAVGAV